MQRFKISLLLALVAVALAQTPGSAPEANVTVSEKPNADVVRVGSRVQCKCGCGDSLATCGMLGCEYSKPGKERIAKLQSLGMNDQQIVNTFLQEGYTYLAPPSPFGWIVPYTSVGFGLIVIWMFLRKYRKPRPVPEIGTIEIDDPALEKYKDQIEKDLANLE